jgi:hypothetical protein
MVSWIPEAVSGQALSHFFTTHLPAGRRWCAHPRLTDLMTDDDVVVMGGCVDALVNRVDRQGISRSLAIEHCRALANVTVNDAIRERG